MIQYAGVVFSLLVDYRPAKGKLAQGAMRFLGFKTMNLIHCSARTFPDVRAKQLVEPLKNAMQRSVFV